jgi:hypothetical protein
MITDFGEADVQSFFYKGHTKINAMKIRHEEDHGP